MPTLGKKPDDLLLLICELHNAGTTTLWGETFSPWTALGAAIIFGSQYHAVRRAARSG